MKQEIFAIYDSKAAQYWKPMFFDTKGIAIRSFMDSLKDTSNLITQHPEDFTLFHLGTFDTTTAKFDQLSTPNSAGLATEFVSTTTQLSPVKPTALPEVERA